MKYIKMYQAREEIDQIIKGKNHKSEFCTQKKIASQKNRLEMGLEIESKTQIHFIRTSVWGLFTKSLN